MKLQTKPFVIVIKPSRRFNKKRVAQSAAIAGEPSTKVPAKDSEKAAAR
jgi:hypothetical protein